MITRYTRCGKRVCTLVTSLKLSNSSSVPRDLNTVSRDQQHYKQGRHEEKWSQSGVRLWGLGAGGVIAASVSNETDETESTTAPSSTVPPTDLKLDPSSVPTYLLSQLDSLYSNGEYTELLSLLDSCADFPSAELLWRHARALWQVFKSQGQNSSILARADRVSQIQDLVDMLDKALELDPNCSAAHHWKAVLSNACSGSAGLKQQFKNLETMKYHLERAIELDPADTVSMTLLGAWHMELLELSWVQRNFISLYCTFPKCSYEEALDLFLKAEDLSPGGSVRNLYLAGKACFRLGRKSEARQYLEQAVNCPVNTKEDQMVLEEAKRFYNSNF